MNRKPKSDYQKMTDMLFYGFIIFFLAGIAGVVYILALLQSAHTSFPNP